MRFRTKWFVAATMLGIVIPTSAAFAAGGAASIGAELQISGSASTGSPNAGSSFSYTYLVKNSGASVATASTFTDTLPTGVGYNTATVNGAPACTVTDQTVACDLGSIASGGQATVVINAYAPTTIGSYSNSGWVATTAPEANLANNAVTVAVSVKTPAVDTIKVTKCFILTPDGGQMLIKAASSDASARLFAYRPDGSLIGEVQNGGGSRYGGTVMPWQFYDPVNVTIRSSSGGSITAPTTPFQI